MYPNTYVSNAFFEIFDECYKALGNSSIYEVDDSENSKRESLYRIKDLLLSSNITTDIKDSALRKYFSRENGTYNNLRDLILHQLIKGSAYANTPALSYNKGLEECDENNFCYFVDSNLQTSKSLPSKRRIVLGDNFLETPFFLNHNFAVDQTDETVPQVEKIKHPCSSLIIIDRYLFQDTRTEQKTPNLIRFLKDLRPSEISTPFEVDIITEISDNDRRITSKYKQITEAIPENLSLHIYAVSNLQEHDRYFITNYALITIGLPFVGNSNISCSFYPSNKGKDGVISAYRNWLNKIKYAKKIVETTRSSIGLLKTIWKSDEIQHSIFNIVE